MSRDHGVRSTTFQRNAPLEELLHEINGALAPAERALPLPDTPQLPVVLVVGPPRSGTTLAMQWLAASGAFAWPTNFMSRFYAAPYLGARIQQLLADPRYNYRDELADAVGAVRFDSELGKTRGLLQPNEFWYFWRRFFPLAWPERLSDAQRAQVDGAGFARGVAAIEAAFQRPFAAKALLVQYDLALLARLLPTAIFLYMRRDPVANAESLLEARRRYWGDETKWYSARPPGTALLEGRSVHEQIAGQVLFTHESIRAELAALPASRWLAVDYESLCEDPAQVWTQLSARARAQGVELTAAAGSAPPRFQQARKVVAAGEREAWERAFATVSVLPR